MRTRRARNCINSFPINRSQLIGVRVVEAQNWSARGVQRRGLMLVLSSPSGAGKSTLCRRLLEAEPDRLRMSVSYTSRPPRTGERAGIDYHFVSPKQFEHHVQAGEFLEHAMVLGHRYGTPRRQVDEALAQGLDVLFDVDWQGARNLAKALEGSRRVGSSGAGSSGERSACSQNGVSDLARVFVLPPSGSALAERLRTRATDSPTTIATRLRMATQDLSHFHEYDYILLNDDFEHTLAQLGAILHAERCRRHRLRQLKNFVAQLRQESETAS